MTREVDGADGSLGGAPGAPLAVGASVVDAAVYGPATGVDGVPGTARASDEVTVVIRPSLFGRLLMLIVWLAVLVRVFTLPMEPGLAVWYLA